MLYIDFDVINETERAYHVIIRGDEGDYKTIWLPKSQVELIPPRTLFPIDSHDNPLFVPSGIMVPRWLAEKHRLCGWCETQEVRLW